MSMTSTSIERRIVKLEIAPRRPTAGNDHDWIAWLTMAEIIYISDHCQSDDDMPTFERAFRPRAEQRERAVPHTLWFIVKHDLPLLKEDAGWSMDNEIEEIGKVVVSQWTRRGLQLKLTQLDINELTLLADLQSKPTNDLGSWTSVVYLALPDEVEAAVGKTQLLARRAPSMDWTSSNRPLILSDLDLDVADYPWPERRRYEGLKTEREWTPHWWKVTTQATA
jgi:hypothetical protein